MYDAPAISPDKKDSSGEDFRQLPKVLLRAEVPGNAGGDPAALRAAVEHRIEGLAADNVVYAELRIAPTQQGFSDVAAAADAALAGAQHDAIDVRIVLVVAAGDSAELAGDIVTQATSHDRIVGVGVAEQDISALAPVLADARRSFVPVTIDAGEVTSTAGVQAALDVADRLGLATNIIDDFSASIDGIEPGNVSAWVRDRHLPIEVVPSQFAGDLVDHPLPLLQQLGFTCTVGVGADETLTDVFAGLHDKLGYGLEEFFDLTVKAVECSFHTEPERQHLIETVILPAYEELSDAEFAEDARGDESDEDESAEDD